MTSDTVYHNRDRAPLADFSWTPVENGYEAVTIRDRRTRKRSAWIVEACPSRSRDRRPRTYRPLEDSPTAFLEAADLIEDLAPDQDHKLVLDFAWTHGLLGLNALHSPEPIEVKLGGASHLGEPLQGWRKALGALRACLDLAEAIDTDDREALFRWIVPQRGPAGRRLRYRRRDKISGLWHVPPAMVRQVIDPYEGSDPRPAARAVISHIATQFLPSHAGGALLLADSGRSLQFGFAPRSLLGALWVQLALKIGGIRDFRRCEECRKWFQIPAPADRRRRQVRHCSAACRQKGYRARREEAIRLRARGKKPSEIAEALGSDLDTVRGWIGMRSIGTGTTGR